MVTLTDKVDEFVDEFDNSFLGKVDDFKSVYNKTFEEDAYSASGVIKVLFSRAVLSLPEGIYPPRDRRTVSLVGDEYVISLTATTNYPDVKNVKASNKFSKDTDPVVIIEWVRNLFHSVIEHSVKNRALEHINEVIGAICEAAGNDFVVEFVSGTKEVEYISDNKVVLSINDLQLDNYENLLLFQDKEDIDIENDTDVDIRLKEENNRRYEEVFNRTLEEFQAESSVMFLQNRSRTLKALSNIGNKHLLTLIRPTVRSDMSVFDRSKKDIEGYYLQDDVFGIVERVDGEYQVLLSPVNVTTGERVDVNILP